MQSESVLNFPSSSPLVITRMRRFVWKIAIATVALMMVGSATRVMNAGLACPDWPLCYGKLIPGQYILNLQVFLEWFHRLDAALIGVSIFALMCLSWFFQKQLPTWFPKTATLALGLIVFQGVLGGLTVTHLLRFDIVTAHLGTALIFLSTLVGMAVASTEYQPTGTTKTLFWSSLVATIVIYAQSVLGGLVASRWAVHQCLNDSQLCQVMNSHLLGVVPATLAVLLVAFVAMKNPSLSPVLKRLALSATGLLVLQILLGVATLRLHLQVEALTVTHHTIATLLLSVLVALNILAQRQAQAVKL